MNSQQQDAVRASITETISELDGLRKKVTQEKWTNLTANVVTEDSTWSDGFKDTNDAYLLALHNAYPALRRAAIAGEALKERIKSASCQCCVKCYSDSFAEWRDDALTYWDICYRSAIEESMSDPTRASFNDIKTDPRVTLTSEALTEAIEKIV